MPLFPLSISTSLGQQNSVLGSPLSSLGGYSPLDINSPSTPSTPSSSQSNGEYKKKRREPQVRSHRCSYCMKSFFRAEHLIRHVRIHTGEKPYVCNDEGCSRRFARRDELARHQKNHNIPGKESPVTKTKTTKKRNNVKNNSSPLKNNISNLNNNINLSLSGPIAPVPYPAHRAQMVSPPPSPATIGNTTKTQITNAIQLTPGLAGLVSSSTTTCTLPCCVPYNGLSDTTTFPPTPQFNNVIYPGTTVSPVPGNVALESMYNSASSPISQQLLQSPLQPISLDCYTPTPEYQLDALFL